MTPEILEVRLQDGTLQHQIQISKSGSRGLKVQGNYVPSGIWAYDQESFRQIVERKAKVEYGESVQVEYRDENHKSHSLT